LTDREWDAEADDVVATLAAQAAGRVVIMSGDKDFHQLLSYRVRARRARHATAITAATRLTEGTRAWP
jgi:5'-3' exonuclease